MYELKLIPFKARLFQHPLKPFFMALIQGLEGHCLPYPPKGTGKKQVPCEDDRKKSNGKGE